MEGPKALESPPVGKVSDPDLSRLLRSVTAEEATDEATDAEWRKLGRGGLAVMLGVGAGRDCSVNESADVGVLPTVLDAAANRWAASWTLEGKVPALALLNPAG
jgi:hypothetical protein